MTLKSDIQWEFLSRLAELILWAKEQGYKLTVGDAYRDPRVFGYKGQPKGYGHPDSFHKDRLAVDLNLFINGDFITTTEGHRKLGEKWESMGGSWGGRFDDANHYSWGEMRGQNT